MTTSNGHQILLAAHIDDFFIACVHRPTLDTFRDALLARFDGTTDGAIQTYLGCEIERDMLAGTITPSQKHCAEDILRAYIVGSLGYLVNMTRTDLAFAYRHIDVGHEQTEPTDIYEHNLACMAMSTNPVRRKSSCHIDIRVHFCRELYTAGVM